MNWFTLQLKELAKAAAAEQAKQAAALAEGIASSAAGSSEEIVIASIELGSDRKALEAAMGTITQRCPNVAVLLLSPDQGAGRVAVMASVPKPLIERGLKAGDVAKAVSGVLGGGGGGRPDRAQGQGLSQATVPQALEAAEAAFAAALV